MIKLALLIGISKYNSQDSQLEPLPAAEKDVEEMAKVLLNPELGGFEESHVHKLINPNDQSMKQKIREVFSVSEKDDFILFYFSGHGVKDENDNLYFATPETRKETVEETGVDSSIVDNIMRKSRSQKQLIILDCCFSGAYPPRSKGGQRSQELEDVNIDNNLNCTGRAVLKSSNSYELSYVSKKSELSIYTRHLIEGIKTGSADKNGDGLISVIELYEYVKQKVQEEQPEMEPKMSLQDEAYKIVIAKAPVRNPKIEYYNLVSRYVEESKGMSDSRIEAILEIRRSKFKLTAEEAEEIKQKVLNLYQDYQKKLDKYKKIVTNAMAENNPLNQGIIIEDLKEIGKEWRLRDKDIALIMEEAKRARNPLRLIQFRTNVLQPTKPSTQPITTPSTKELLFKSAFTGFEGVLLTIALASLLGTTLINAWFWLWLLIILGTMIFIQSRYQMEILVLPLIASITFCLVWLIPRLQSVIENSQISTSNSLLIIIVMAIFGGVFLFTLMAFWLLIARSNR